MTQRKEKVAQRIKKEVSEIIHDEIKDPRIGFLTITKVELTSDLRLAKISYSILGTPEQEISAECGLKSAQKFIRKLLGERLKIRYTPEICFKIDKSSEYSIYMNKIFEQISKEREEKKGNKND